LDNIFGEILKHPSEDWIAGVYLIIDIQRLRNWRRGRLANPERQELSL
jgi:hypothetical protein